MATHVELFEEGLRTRVQIPPAPPYPMTKAANYNQLAAFFFGNPFLGLRQANLLTHVLIDTRLGRQHLIALVRLAIKLARVTRNGLL